LQKYGLEIAQPYRNLNLLRIRLKHSAAVPKFKLASGYGCEIWLPFGVLVFPAAPI
jgi:hypothetical protein